MLFEESINSWALQISWFLDHKSLLAFTSQFKRNVTINNFSKKGFIRNENDAYIGYVVLFWSVSYLIYEKWLNLLLRRKCFPLIQRNRIISTIWDCIFCISTLNYLLYTFSLSSESSMLPKLTKFNVLLYKSFYIHHAGVNIFILGAWMKGWSDLLFAFFAFSCHWERLDPSIVLLFFLKIIDTSILAICRLLLCFWNKQISKTFAKILFIFHCLTWTYIYMAFVPEYVLWGSNSKYALENFHMWLWFVSECLNSVWLKLFFGFDVYLFPPPSKEAIDFGNRLRKQKAVLKKKPIVQNAKKAELLKTLTCVMSIKKKLQRLRKAKEAKLYAQAEVEEEEKEEVDCDEATKQSEIMQTLICTVRKEIQKIRKEKRNNLDPQAVTPNDETGTDFESSGIEEKTDKNIKETEEKTTNPKIEETSV